MEPVQGLIDILTRALQALPDVVVEEVEAQSAFWRASRPDAVLSLKVKGQPIRLLVETRQSGYPRDMREAVYQLSAAQSALPDGEPSVFMVVVPLLSETSREYLRQNRIGYCEAGGSLSLETPWAFFSVEKPLARRPARRAGGLYRGSRAQVLHVLLSKPDQEWRIGTLARESETHLSTVHHVFTQLEDEGFMTRHGSGPHVVRRLTEPGKLLDSWAKAHTLQDYNAHAFYRWAKSPRELREAVTDALHAEGVPYALTLTSGAELVAPFVTAVNRLTLLVPADAPLASALSAARLEAVEDGANVTLLLTTGRAPLLLRRKIQGVWVAGDVQLYLDLMDSTSRDQKQAAHLRGQRLSFEGA